MFRKKLRALNYHSPDGELSLAAVDDLKPLVVWLEDQKIRYYKIEDRGSLRDADGKNWETSFKKYLQELECPYRPDIDLPAVVDWLLGVAIRYEFNEIAESNPSVKRPIGQEVQKGSDQGGGGGGDGNGLDQLVGDQSSQPAKSPLDVDPSDPIFVSGTQALAKILQITSHPDPAILLEAIRIVIVEKLSESALSDERSKSATAAAAAKPKDAKKYKISAKECGFDLGDPILSEAAKVLRLLHIQELRHLQTHINELIVAVQAITANPKTDQSLGQVGR